LVNILPDKTLVDFEIAASNDNNLFSTIDDANNTGISAKINVSKQD
jgi:hypothetical protein